MSTQTSDFPKILEPYQKGWVALNKRETKVLAHANTFAEINEKIKNYDPNEVVLFPLGHTRSYFVGFLNG